ncbi:MAG: PBP1A family penicillin-binding protein [Candidatus Kapabacteria bacterium]|nr:PBP1A family penicillin-binding protein [Candidatus Kapabacteria bacterium]
MNPRRLIIILASTTIFTFAAVSTLVYFTVKGNLPSLEQLENPPVNQATQILSENGDLLDHFFIEKRVNLSFNQIPKDFINALVATEDRKFYSHWGVDIDRIIKAGLKNIAARHAKEGASTLTQQLARNLFLDQSPTFGRKIKEAATAVQIEDTYTKEEILEMYANTVGFGRGAYGINVAAKTYFNKKANEMSLAECAFLVGLLKAPSRYDARANYDRALNRRNLVLNLMSDQGFITKEQFWGASEEPININLGKRKRVDADIAPHFVENIRQQLNNDSKLEQYDLYRDGLIINTTLNSTIQKYANESIEQHLKEFQKTFDASWKWSNNQKLLNSVIADGIRKNNEYKSASKENKPDIEAKLRKNLKFIDSVKNVASTIQVGLIALDAHTGAIIAMVGASPKFMDENPEYKYSLNHTTQIRRQPGSSFKPFVYAMALKQGMKPEDMIECGPYSYRDPGSGLIWSPSVTEDDCQDAGSRLPLSEALRKSINSVAARLITQVTNPTDVKNLIEQAGVKSKLLAVPALALGAGGEVSPLELTSAYSIFANEGIHVEPYLIKSILDKNGNTIFERRGGNVTTEVLDKEIAKTMTKMLRQVVDAGTAARIRQVFKGIEAAGKTGTTNDNADAWFVGYTPQLICGIWVGFDDQRINFDVIGRQGQGGRAAAPIWALLMNKIYNDPNLPYKQKTFGYDVVDSLNLNESLIAPQVQATQTKAPTNQRAEITTTKKNEPKPEAKKENPVTTQGNSTLPKLPKK